MSRLHQRIHDAVFADERLLADFHAICNCGGRRCGSESELAARQLLATQLRQIADTSDGRVWSQPLPYQGWSPGVSRLRTPDGPWRPVEALLWSPATPPEGLEAHVVDLGRGAQSDFVGAADRIAGAMVIVRHEYMFAPDHIHRSVKYEWAREYGAAGFLIAGPTVVAGSSGEGRLDDIVAGGIDEKTAKEIAEAGRVRLQISIEEGPAETENLFLDLPGESEGRVVLSAHIDGHAPGESALDNATGLAACLSAARTLARFTNRCSLRVAFFSLEEWGLDGSRHHVEGLDDAARREIAVNVNLDTVAGADNLTALTSGFAKLEQLMTDVGRAVGIDIACFDPLRENSDHYNFAVAGIPAFRLVAGFSEPGSNVRHLLTAGDTRDKARLDQLQKAAVVAAIACHMATPEYRT